MRPMPSPIYSAWSSSRLSSLSYSCCSHHEYQNPKPSLTYSAKSSKIQSSLSNDCCSRLEYQTKCNTNQYLNWSNNGHRILNYLLVYTSAINGYHAINENLTINGDQTINRDAAINEYLTGNGEPLVNGDLAVNSYPAING